MSNEEDSSGNNLPVSALELAVVEDIVLDPPGTPPENTTVQEADSTTNMATLYIPQIKITCKRIVGVVHTLHHYKAAE